ncbi:MAG: hypothetical protein U1E43_03760 [Rhodospirillales bacterium]
MLEQARALTNRPFNVNVFAISRRSAIRRARQLGSGTSRRSLPRLAATPSALAEPYKTFLARTMTPSGCCSPSARQSSASGTAFRHRSLAVRDAGIAPSPPPPTRARRR